MTPKDIEIIDTLLHISVKKVISKHYKSVFTELFSNLVHNIRTADSTPYKRYDILLPLMVLDDRLSEKTDTKVIRDFKNVLLKSFEKWFESLLLEIDTAGFKTSFNALMTTVEKLPNEITRGLDGIRSKFLDDIIEKQENILEEIESLFLLNAKAPGQAGLQQAEHLAIHKKLTAQTKKYEKIIQYIISNQDMFTERLDRLIDLRTRRVTQNLLLEDDAKPFVSFLKSDQSRSSDGRCEALRVANVYIEMSLDRISDGQRDSLRKTAFIRNHRHKTIYGHAFQTVSKASFSKKAPELLKAMQICINKKEDLNIADKELRLLSRQRIEHAIVKRRFSFKARPKHFNYTDAAQSMRDLRKTLDKAGVDFFLMSGTLLGAVREKGFIASDYDIDIGIFDSQADIPLLNRICAESPLFSIHEVVENSIVKVKHISGIVIDLFIYFDIDGLQCHRGGVHEWYNGPFGLTEINFLGGRYYIPDNYEEWLAENYGNWEKPVLFYDMSYDTPNRDYISTSTRGIYYLHDRIQNALRKGWNNYIFMGLNAMKREFGIDLTKHLPPALRRHEKLEHPTTKFAANDVDIVLVGYYDGISQSLSQNLDRLSDTNKTIFATICSEAVSGELAELTETSLAERCKAAQTIAPIKGITCAETSDELIALKSMYKHAKFIYLDGISPSSTQKRVKLEP